MPVPCKETSDQSDLYMYWASTPQYQQWGPADDRDAVPNHPSVGRSVSESSAVDNTVQWVVIRC